MEQGAKSVQGGAHERFVESLGSRAQELGAAVALLEAAPTAAAREKLKHQLHALLANAQLYEEVALAEEVQRVVARFGVEPAPQAPTPEDFDALKALVAELAVRDVLDRPRVTHSGVHKVVEVDVAHSPTDADSVAPIASDSVAPIASDVHELRPRRRSQVDTLPFPSEPGSNVVPAQRVSHADALPLPSEAEPQVLPAQTVPEPQVLAAQTQPDPQVLPAQPEPDRQVMLAQTVPGLLASPVRARALLVCSRPHASRFRELLDGKPIELVHAADAEEAIRLLHAASPAFALLSAEFANLPDIDLIRRMQTDPLSRLGGVYVVLPEGASYDAGFLQQTGADGVLVEPLSAARIIELAEHSAQRVRGSVRPLRSLTGGTVDEIASHVAEEIRRGIADSLRAGQHERIGLGDSQELMSAAWSAIGRVRSHLAEQSRGRVRFRDDDAARELPSFLSADARAHASEPSAAPVLAGKRVLVADDDPAVLWFFSGLLRESSALVLQAHNGREALELARRKQPHLVLSDILMPKIDGFALCREIKRDALLSHVPVILLSWKDDLLERMRELDAGASGYLRKEAGSREILAAITEVLQPRHELALALRTQNEVSGRLDKLGVVALLETTAAERPDARMTVQDAWSLFEVELRSGQRLSVTRTAADGSFARGERALLQLIGANTGRYCINISTTTLRQPLAEALGSALQHAGKTLSALLDAVSDTRLVHVALLAFEDDVVDMLLSCTPTRLHEVVARFRVSGSTAKDLLFDGSFTPGELEGHLRELARHAAINGVWNAEGDDLVAMARRERDEQPGTLLHSSSPPGGGTAWFSSLRPSAPTRGEADAPSEDGRALQPSAPDELGFDQEPWDTGEQTEPDASTAQRAAAATDGESAVSAEAAPSAPNEAFEGMRLLLTLAALVAIGYLGWQKLEPYTRLGVHPQINATTVRQASTQPALAEAPVATRAKAPAEPSASSKLETTVQSGNDPSPTMGRILPYVDEGRGVAVGPEQGLLVVEYTGTAPLPSIRIGGRELGRPPIAVALDAGRHELVVHRNREASFRYLIVRAGETRIITLPL
jgi:CheY-like chemotaxis protein